MWGIHTTDAKDSRVSPQKSNVEALTPNGMVFGGGAFARRLGLDETVKARPRDGVSALVRGDASPLALPLSVPTTDGVDRRWPLEARRAFSLEINHAAILILDFQLPEL